ncbi:MAG TPA: hypothetical protein VGU27_10130, partial [Candidatus Eisenbacteria bacterium]|nr:hypothetical protein [Candidatus Eisenbacteria bacterium]
LARRLAPALPIALDPSLRVAQALGGVAGGPALVIADERGRVVLDTTGALAAGESALRAILARTRPDAVLPPAAGGAPLPVVRELRFSPGRIAAGPLAGAEPGRERMYAPVFRYQEEGRPETPYPVGEWRLDPDGLTATRGGAASFVAIRYSAARAGVVLSPPRDGAARVWVLRDGDWPAAAHRGEDVAAEGGAAVVEVREPRLYWVDQGGGMRTLRLSPDRPGVTLHALVLADAPR